MARVNKIFITLFLVLSIFPIAEYLLFVFQNPTSGITLSPSSSVQEVNFVDNYIIIKMPEAVTSFQDYVILNYSYGTVTNNTMTLNGLSKTIFKFLCYIVQSGSRLGYSPLLIDMFVFSSLLLRSVYIACSLFFVYLIILPVMLPLTLFKRRSKT